MNSIRLNTSISLIRKSFQASRRSFALDKTGCIGYSHMALFHISYRFGSLKKAVRVMLQSVTEEDIATKSHLR